MMSEADAGAVVAPISEASDASRRPPRSGLAWAVLSGVFWGADGVVLGVALAMAPFVVASALVALRAVAALHDGLSSSWMPASNGVTGRLKLLPRSLLSRPGLILCAAAVIGGPIAMSGLLIGCGGQPTNAGADASPAPSSTRQPSAAADAPAQNEPAATISDRDGPSWSGRLGDTVQVDWYDQASGETRSERIAVLAVKRVPNPDDDGGPSSEFGDDYGPYEWKYAIKVRLTSLDAATVRTPIVYQFLSLSDGSDSEDGVAGLGTGRGPDPSRVGKSSVGWLYQWAEEGFIPTEVLMPIGAWRAQWSLD